jgi:hypothetical protein
VVQTKATNYPLTLTVPGTVSGTISSIQVVLNGLSFNGNLFAVCGTGFLLKAPGGQNMAIFEAPDGADCSATWSNVTLTLTDSASSIMGDGGPPPPLGTGTYFPGSGGGTTITTAQTFKPTSYKQGMTVASLIYPSPGPVNPSNRPAPQGSATLGSVFGGATAVGTWSLYLIDSDNDTVSISSFSLKLVMAAVAPTTTTITSSVNPTWTATPNNITTLTATVTSSGSAVTSGTVTFTDGATTLCSAVAVNGSGLATCNASFSTEGVHTPTATYNGTGSYGTSNASLNQWVKNHSTLSSGNYCNSGAINLPNGSGWSPHPSVINIGTGYDRYYELGFHPDGDAQRLLQPFSSAGRAGDAGIAGRARVSVPVPRRRRRRIVRTG